jgi:diguanylate cyclase (GGDEF)-like protein/PAS domain S-box-containing protein
MAPREAADSAHSQPLAAEAKSRAAKARGRSLAFFLISPLTETRYTLAAALEGPGHRVRTLASPREFSLQRLPSAPIIAVLVAEPSATAEDTVRQLATLLAGRRSEIWVACTSHEAQALEGLAEAGATDFLALPVDADQTRLRKRLAHRRLYPLSSDSTLTRVSEGAAKRERGHLSWAIQQVPSVLWATDRELRITSMLGAGMAVFSGDHEAAFQGTVFDLFDQDDEGFAPIQAARKALEGKGSTFEFDWLEHTFEARTEPLRDEERRIIGGIGIAFDISKRRQAEEALSLQEAYFHQLFENSPQAIVILDPTDRILKANPGFEQLFGFSTDQLQGRFINDVIVPPQTRDEASSLSQAVLGGEVVRAETARCHKNGSVLYVSILGYPIQFQGRIIGVYGIYNDITERKHSEAQLRHEALHDSLTGLPNRALFLDRLDHCLTLAQRRQEAAFAVLFLDLDRFKVINDSLGHSLGDRLLVAIANRLLGALRPADTFARLGGDEFVVMLEDLANPGDAVRVAERIHEALASPFELDGNEIFTSASIGIAFSNRSYQHPEELIRDADTAMYRAKTQGRACHAVFDREMHFLALERLRLETDLRRAFDRQEFCLYYQPIINLRKGKITGFEALLRWRHPSRGLLSPQEFLAVAEETSLTVDLCPFVLEEVCQLLRSWQGRHPLVGISVNVSAKQFLQSNLVPTLDNLLQSYCLPPDSLRLEITESTLLQNSKVVEEILNDLKAHDVRLYLDDFGTGYSSLGYLQNFPIDTLKIDRSFISETPGRRGKPEIVRAIISLAHSLGIDVIAEGIETQGQLDKLRDLGCEQGQGYLFACPLPASKATALLLQEPCWGSSAED